MTNVQLYINDLPENVREELQRVFLSFDKFYPAVYLLVKNEHLTGEEKPERFEERMEMIQTARRKTEVFLDKIGLNGVELVADIASDYFEDYINYKETEFEISNQEFLDIINNIMSQNLTL